MILFFACVAVSPFCVIEIQLSFNSPARWLVALVWHDSECNDEAPVFVS